MAGETVKFFETDGCLALPNGYTRRETADRGARTADGFE